MSTGVTAKASKLFSTIPDVTVQPGASGRVGEFVSAPGSGDVVVVTDRHIAEKTPHLQQVLDALDASDIAPSVHVVAEDQCGYLSSAAAIRSRIQTEKPSACVALGGGTVLDAAKLAIAARREPWLLDRPVWVNGIGALASPGSATAGPALTAVPTIPGSAAHVSDRVCLAPEPGHSRRLVQSPALLPTSAVVDVELSTTLNTQTLLESICEVLYRAIAPYLVTHQSTPKQDRNVAAYIADLLGIGASLLTTRSLSPKQRIALDKLSIETMLGHHTEGWAPVSHPWWCIQNSVLTSTTRSKGALTAHALPHVFARIEAGDERLGSHRRWRKLHKHMRQRDHTGQELVEFLTAVDDHATAHPRASSPENLLDTWARDAYVLWANLVPGIRALGVNGIRTFLKEAGF